MKNFTCLLLSVLIFSTPILAQNPCEDSTYLELKQKKLDELSDREYEYFTRKDTECSAYLSKTPKKSQNINLNKDDLNSDGLNSEQVKYYNRRKLNIELTTKTSGGVFATPIGKSAVGGFGAETSRKWKAYEGFDNISELQFFKLTGYNIESEKIIKFSNNMYTMAIVGIGLLGIGIVILSGSPEKPYCNVRVSDSYTSSQECISDRSEAESKQSGNFGYFMLLGSIGTGLITYAMIKLSGTTNYHPYSTVDGIAEEYNKKLLQKIKRWEQNRGTTP